MLCFFEVALDVQLRDLWIPTLRFIVRTRYRSLPTVWTVTAPLDSYPGFEFATGTEDSCNAGKSILLFRLSLKFHATSACTASS